jgi:uncharacterized membrane protein YhaH (DUF805 family)
LQLRGRATRREYWLFMAQIFVGLVLLTFAMQRLIVAFTSMPINLAMTLIILAYVAYATVAYWTASVRRLHDHDKSGWLFLLSMIPVVGWLFYLIMMLTPGTDGENDYGPDPRQGDVAEQDMSAVFS